MANVKKYISMIIVFLLTFSTLNLQVYGETFEKERTTKELNVSTHEVKTPKKSEKGINASTNPNDYKLVNENGQIGTLEDSNHYSQTFTYLTTTEKNSDQMSISIQRNGIGNPPLMDPITSIEFFKNNGGELKYLFTLDFDLTNYQNVRLLSTLSKYYFEDQAYIYMRLGISKSQSSQYYSDVTTFKVVNPFYENRNVPPIGGKRKVLISNESVDGESYENTGGLKIENNNYTFSKKLTPQTYKMDVVLPFEFEKNKMNTLTKSIKQKKVMNYNVGDKRDFWVTDLETDKDYQISAELKYSGSKAYVWVHNNELTSSEAEKIGKEFDEKIYPLVTENFAPESDVDGDGKINILTFDIQDGFNGYGGYIAGYFYGRDLSHSFYSNKSEVLYIDTYPSMGLGATKDLTDAFETIVHEFQHMVNFNQNVLIEGSTNMDIWMNEGLSMAAEQMYKKEPIDYRIDYYNYSSSIANGHSLLYWDYYGDTLANYSLSYLFFQYVKIHADKGDRVFQEILQDANNDYKAVEKIVQKYIDQTMSFGQFMTNFRAALFLNEPTGLHGFKGDPISKGIAPRTYNGYNSLNLRGGGAVVVNSIQYNKPTNSGPNITYTLLDKNNGPADITPPEKPKVNAVSDKDTAITGTAEPGSTIYVYNEKLRLGSGKASSSGSFKIDIKKQKAGTKLTVFAVDESGNESKHVTITVLDRTPPAKPTVNTVGDNSTSVTGKAEAGSTVYVYRGYTRLGYGKSSSKGNFKVSINKQKAGTKLTVYAVDSAKNKSASATVTVKDKTPPKRPTVKTVSNKSKYVRGKAEAGSTVYVYRGKKRLGSGKASKKGNYKIKIKKQKAGKKLKVYAVDKAKNKSKTRTVKVKDKIPPKKPTVKKVTSKSRTVKGKTEKYATVYVYKGKKLLGKKKANKKGNYTVKIKKQKKGTKLKVYAKDKAGNKSKTRTIKVK